MMTCCSRLASPNTIRPAGGRLIVNTILATLQLLLQQVGADSSGLGDVERVATRLSVCAPRCATPRPNVGGALSLLGDAFEFTQAHELDQGSRIGLLFGTVQILKQAFGAHADHGQAAG